MIIRNKGDFSYEFPFLIFMGSYFASFELTSIATIGLFVFYWISLNHRTINLAWFIVCAILEL